MSCISLLRELEHNVGMNLSLGDVAKLMPNLLSDDYFMSMLVRRDYPHHKHADTYDKEAHKKLTNMTRVSRLYDDVMIQHETLCLIVSINITDEDDISCVCDWAEGKKILSSSCVHTYCMEDEENAKDGDIDVFNRELIRLIPYVMANYDMIGKQDNIYFMNGKTHVFKTESYLTGIHDVIRCFYSDGTFGDIAHKCIDNMLVSGDPTVYDAMINAGYNHIVNPHRFICDYQGKHTIDEMNHMLLQLYDKLY